MVQEDFLPGLHTSAFEDGDALIFRFFMPRGATNVTVIDLLPGFIFVIMNVREFDFSMSTLSSAIVPSDPTVNP